MGKYFIEDTEIFRVKFDDEQWVDIKQELSQADNDYIISKMVRASSIQDGTAPKADIEMNLGRQSLLERSIVAWSFADESGVVAPITPENISNLKGKYRSRVLKEIDRLNKGASGFLAG